MHLPGGRDFVTARLESKTVAFLESRPKNRSAAPRTSRIDNFHIAMRHFISLHSWGHRSDPGSVYGHGMKITSEQVRDAACAAAVGQILHIPGFER
jgi:hypothetical protein